MMTLLGLLFTCSVKRERERDGVLTSALCAEDGDVNAFHPHGLKEEQQMSERFVCLVVLDSENNVCSSEVFVL
jgi:hypothetical protein